MNFNIIISSEEKSVTSSLTVSLESWLIDSEIEGVKIGSETARLNRDDAAGLTLTGVLTVATGGLIARYAEPLGKAIYGWLRSKKRKPKLNKSLKLTINFDDGERLIIEVDGGDFSEEQIIQFLSKRTHK